MAKQQDPSASLPLATSDQIIPPALLGTPLDREAEPPHTLRQPVLDGVDPSLVVGAGVDRRKEAQVGYVLVEVLLEVGDDGVAHRSSFMDRVSPRGANISPASERRDRFVADLSG